MELSSRLSRFNEPETLKMAKLGRELRQKGIDVIDLSLGEPDFNTPEHIKEAAKKPLTITILTIRLYAVMPIFAKPSVLN